MPPFAGLDMLGPQGDGSGNIGRRHGHRSRQLMGTFGSTTILVPWARLYAGDGRTTQWVSTSLRAYQRRTKAADALIASTYLTGTNTRRVRRALAAVFGGAVGKDTVSRVWRKVQTDWEAWNKRPWPANPLSASFSMVPSYVSGMTAKRQDGLYRVLGVRTIINAKGPATRLSGGIIRPEVAAAMV
jgi:hypothetical protein